MATAPQQGRAARRIGAEWEPSAITFLVFEDNGGEYRWTILDGHGESLAQSGTFESYEAAQHAAGVVRDGVASARFQPRSSDDLPAELVARREAARERYDSDPDRWLEERGSVDSEGMSTWPAER